MEVRQKNFWKFRNKIRGKSFSLNLNLTFWLFSELKVRRWRSCEFRKRSMPAIFTSRVYSEFTCLLSPFLCTFFAFKSFFSVIASRQNGQNHDMALLLLYRLASWDHFVRKSRVYEFEGWVPSSRRNSLTDAWLAQLVERQSAVREVEGSSPRPDQHSGS